MTHVGSNQPCIAGGGLFVAAEVMTIDRAARVSLEIIRSFADLKVRDSLQPFGDADVPQDIPTPEEPMVQKQLNDLFFDTLKDVYFAERQILKSLPKMAKAAQSEELKSAFLKHREETEGQIERLQQVFEILGKRAQGKTCEAINGILEEGAEIIEEYKGSDALDAGLVAGGQAVEHYEIARYGALKNWAIQLGMKDAADLLNQTLQEEKKTDALLTSLAESQVNRKAA